MSEIHHTFTTKAHDLAGLFVGTTTLGSFCKKLEKQAQLDPARYPVQNYVGDGFEMFVEVLLALHPCDNRLGVYNYKPNQTIDNGVDGRGVNIRLEPCVVQVKYRANTAGLLTANEDHLGNLLNQGMLDFNIVADREDRNNFRHFVFTTAKGLHFYTDHEVFKDRVKCFGYDEIKNLVDNNLIFWAKAQALVTESLIAKRNPHKV